MVTSQGVDELIEKAADAKRASRALAQLTAAQKNDALRAVAVRMLGHPGPTHVASRDLLVHGVRLHVLLEVPGDDRTEPDPVDGGSHAA